LPRARGHAPLRPVKTVLAAAAFAMALPPAPAFSQAEGAIDTLSAALADGRTTSEAAVRGFIERIEAVDRDGPRLRSVLALNPDAIADAKRLDAERKAGRLRGPLHGVPVLIKDNIESRDRMATTAGSLALKDNVTGRDAPLVARLRAAGAVILGKTNLSEWANIRSTRSTSGWSAVGGLTRNPHAADRNSCGSSSGSGAAMAAALATATIGTETDGSVTCPAAVNGIVGLKPTVGLVSRTHIVPISHSQDTAGPMTATVADAARLLTVIAGRDPADPATAEADRRREDYTRALDAGALSGKRIGVLRFAAGFDPAVEAVFDRAVAELKAAGAVPVEIADLPGREKIGEDELKVLLTELKHDLNAYLATTPAAVKTRTLAQVIAFNEANAEAEMPFFGQELFKQAEATKGLDAEYRRARADSLRRAGAEGIDRLLAANKVVALVSPTVGPAWVTDVVLGDHYEGGESTTLAAVAGYPHLTVPMGDVHGLPVGLSFIGPKWSEARLLGLGYAYEQKRGPRAAARLLPTIAGEPAVKAGTDR
jgi:amidase